MTDNQDFFSLNNIDLDKAYEVTIGARGGGKLFFFEQLCIKQREELNRLQAENERLEKNIETETNHITRLENQIERLLQRIKTIKAEAYQEFAEKIDQKWLLGTLCYAFSDGYTFDSKEDVIELSKFLAEKIKELVGESNA